MAVFRASTVYKFRTRFTEVNIIIPELVYLYAMLIVCAVISVFRIVSYGIPFRAYRVNPYNRCWFVVELFKPVHNRDTYTVFKQSNMILVKEEHHLRQIWICPDYFVVKTVVEYYSDLITYSNWIVIGKRNNSEYVVVNLGCLKHNRASWQSLDSLDSLCPLNSLCALNSLWTLFAL